MKRFTVIIPCRNPDSERLRYCLQSIRRQSDAQIILVDDATADVGTCLSLASEVGAAVFRCEESAGLVAAVNMGIRQATGEYVHVLPPEDYPLQGLYGFADVTIRTRGFVTLLAIRYLLLDELGRVTHSFPGDHYNRLPMPLSHGNPLRPCAFFVRRDHYEDHPWNESLSFDGAAWEAWIRASLESYGILDWPLVAHLSGPEVYDVSRLAAVVSQYAPYLCQRDDQHGADDASRPDGQQDERREPSLAAEPVHVVA